MPPGYLAPRCINGKGRIIDEKINEWVDLNPTSAYDEFKMYDLVLDETGEFSGSISFRENDYAAMRIRKNLSNSLSEEKFIEDIENEYPGLHILEHELNGTEVSTGPISGKYNVEITNMSEFMGNMISVNPFMYERIKENPLKLEERKFPVNFNYPFKTQYVFKCKLPKGYEVESIPENMNMSFPDKSARFLFSASVVGDFLNVNSTLQVNRHLYISEEYKILKMFYDQMISKQSEMILIKKTQSAP